MSKRINTHKSYILDNKEYPSVTTILKLLNKDGLQHWANYLGFKRIRVDDVLSKSADIGTYVHYLCECHLMDYGYLKYNARNIQMIMDVGHRYLSFKKFLEEHDVKTISCETSIISSKLGFAGTNDFLGEIDGKLTILDFKTSKKFYDTMFYQLSAYNELFKEKGIEAEQFAVLLLHEDDYKLKIISKGEIEKYWRVFESLVKVYYLLEEI